MRNKPLNPTTHLALDYGMAALLLTAPRLLGLGLRARMISYLFGTVVGGLTLGTRSRITPMNVVTPREHGKMESAALPTMLLLPWVTGAMKRPVAGAFFLGACGMALANYLMTDFDADDRASVAQPPAAEPAVAHSSVTHGVLRRADGILSPR